MIFGNNYPPPLRCFCSRSEHLLRSRSTASGRALSGHDSETKSHMLGVQSWSPLVTQKSGHIWQCWLENDPGIHAEINQVSPNIFKCQGAFPSEFAEIH